MRLWVASTDYRGEVAVSDEIFKRTSDSYRRVRNTARFMLSNLDGFDPKTDLVASADMLSLDSWAVDRAAQLQGEILESYDAYQFHVIYQKLHNFCSNDMGGFYLDVIKDRLYTTAPGSAARRSAQSAMYHIMCALTHWVAPIISYTAEEIWENLPGERPESVLLSQWYGQLDTLGEDVSMGRDYWQQAIEVRSAVNREMESQRSAGVLRGALDAKVTLFCSPDLFKTLDALGEELRFMLITSGATLSALDDAPAESAETEIEGLRLQVVVSDDEKCGRCWHRSPDVGQIEQHPTICGRCVENIDGAGEIRRFV